MGVYYGMNGLWVPVGGQGGAAPVDPNLLAENIKSGVTISGITGTFTNDGTAKSSDMADGVTAYVNGQKVTGTIKDSTSGWIFDDSTPKPLPSPQEITYMAMSFSPTIDLILRSGTKCYTRTSPSNFGDATAADVAFGKTFTSNAGLKVTGTNEVIPNCSVTMINQSGRALQAFVIDNNGATLAYHFNASGSTRYVTTKHPFFIAGLDPDNNSGTYELSISMSGLQDLGTSTNNTFEYIKVYGFKPTDTTATITIS